ncbi:single-stranded DNA-binding protein [Demequina capsici]|uniref:Single-stranded DNA-binding protein n=1 Tax=Demequina capsici TaxID=3075620 RepID=A0AA96JC36_9MICO|nr:MULTISPECIES: single-stranded DNA-binding protein [unclassified Demequina]WNM23294.1 single-stranded DNA-binding protein [Demequina sp. OYTSA14]WNM26172.1 single-stranded DNA-binding protein [Demequina sp. PMTSA13]
MTYVATGRAASELEHHGLPGGEPICTFQLACTRRDRSGTLQTDWFTVRMVGDDAIAGRDLVRLGVELVVTGTLRAAPRAVGSTSSSWMLIDLASLALPPTGP